MSEQFLTRGDGSLWPDLARTPATAEGQNAKNAVDFNTRALLVTPASGVPRTAAPSNSAPITSAADISLAAGQKLFVQNLGVNPLFVKLGTGASTSSFSYVLQAADGPDNGTGGSIEIDDFIGAVSFAGTSVRYNAWKR